MPRVGVRAGLAATVTATAIILVVAAVVMDAHKAITSPYTYNDHVYPIVLERCSRCHYEGGPTPMSLMSYTDAVPWAESMREQFLNPADIGGRYSALSYVGLVPASLLGVDLDPLLAAATAAVAAAREPDPAANPALALGCIMAALAREGRDKLTLVVDAPIDGLGAWVEQLVAESTGKLGVGVVPIYGEPLGGVAAYGDDRLFVRIRLRGGVPPRCADGGDADTRLEIGRAHV